MRPERPDPKQRKHPDHRSPRTQSQSDGRRALGNEGEARAARFLEQRGYRIAARNVRAGGVEVDLIATRGPLVAIVEVKTRRTTRYGPPELAVDAAKQARLARAASAWLRETHSRARRVRFDVISCLAPHDGRGDWQIEHLEGAFVPGD